MDKITKPYLTIPECLEMKCTGRPKALGLCSKHYASRRRAGTIEQHRHAVEKMLTDVRCDICDRPSRARKYRLCELHFGRLRRSAGLDSTYRKPTGECHNCGQPTDKVHCSNLCATRTSRGQIGPNVIRCEWCGTEREGRVDGRFCSQGCYMKAWHLMSNYGLAIKDYRSLMADQGHSCAICASSFQDAPHVDHCHESGRVRGLLCGACNTGLGMFKEDPLRLTAAIAYLAEGG